MFNVLAQTAGETFSTTLTILIIVFAVVLGLAAIAGLYLRFN